jgi:hypothetical protein
MAELQKSQSGYGATLKAINSSNAAVLQCKKDNPTHCL